MNSMLKECKMTRVMTAQAAGTDDVNSDVVDMQGFEGVEFCACFGTLTASAVTSVKVQQGAKSDGSDMADLAGTSVSIADTDDNKMVLVDVYRPEKQYVRLVVDRGTANAVIDCVCACQYGARKVPVTQSTTVAASEFHVSPAEGTA